MNTKLTSVDVDTPFVLNGKTVTVWHDECPSNPWDDMDCCTPVMFAFPNGSVKVNDYGDGILTFFNHVSVQWVERNRIAVCNALDLPNPDRIEQEARVKANGKGYTIGDARFDVLEEQLAYLRTAYRPERFLTVLANLYRLLGWTVRLSDECGYCQGDQITVLLVSTPAHLARCGGKRKDVESTLPAEAEMLRSWAFGDVYGFTVTDPATGEKDSCGGFYGVTDTRDSGLLDAIEEACPAPEKTL